MEERIAEEDRLRMRLAQVEHELCLERLAHAAARVEACRVQIALRYELSPADQVEIATGAIRRAPSAPVKRTEPVRALPE